jgi:hypothetical protein
MFQYQRPTLSSLTLVAAYSSGSAIPSSRERTVRRHLRPHTLPLVRTQWDAESTTVGLPFWHIVSLCRVCPSRHPA